MPWLSVAPLLPAFTTIGTQTYLTERNATLYGGTTEIQKETIWRSMCKSKQSGAS